MNASGKGRLTELDSLRGLAALSVCFFHFSPNIRLFNTNIVSYGVTGVDLFFLISGFVIFMSLTKINSIKDFWTSRFFRLYPAYWFSVLIAALTFYIFKVPHIKYNLKFILGNLLMLQPVFRSGYLVDAYWTLYVELCFYLTISLIWYFKKIDKIENTIIIGLVLMAAFNGLYFLNIIPSYSRLFIVVRGLFPLLSHLNMFAAGIIFYRIYTNGFDTKKGFILTLCFLLTALVHTLGGRVFFYLNTREHLFCILGYFLIFLLIIYKKIPFLGNSLFTFFGTISYSLYLIHQSIGIQTEKLYVDKLGLNFAIIIGLSTSVLLAILTTYFIERPILSYSKSALQRYGKTTVKTIDFI